jgi:hypothetical protein
VADITFSVSVRYDKDYLSGSMSANNVTANMSLAGLKSDTYTLSTNAVSISTANLTTLGLAFLRNLATATAATVTVGIEEGGSFVGLTTLRAGEPAVFRMATGTAYKAIGSAGARLRVDITEG